MSPLCVFFFQRVRSATIGLAYRYRWIEKASAGSSSSSFCLLSWFCFCVNVIPVQSTLIMNVVDSVSRFWLRRLLRGETCSFYEEEEEVRGSSQICFSIWLNGISVWWYKGHNGFPVRRVFPESKLSVRFYPKDWNKLLPYPLGEVSPTSYLSVCPVALSCSQGMLMNHSILYIRFMLWASPSEPSFLLRKSQDGLGLEEKEASAWRAAQQACELKREADTEDFFFEEAERVKMVVRGVIK
jgi:hypothetical protein